MNDERLLPEIQEPIATDVASDEPQGTSRKRRKKKTADPSLLGDLIDSRFFQILIGKQSPFGPAIKKSTRDRKRAKQSFTALTIDLVIFATLVIVAPVYTICRFILRLITAYWWSKFLLGIATGCGVMYGLFLLLRFIFG